MIFGGLAGLSNHEGCCSRELVIFCVCLMGGVLWWIGGVWFGVGVDVL